MIEKGKGSRVLVLSPDESIRDSAREMLADICDELHTSIDLGEALASIRDKIPTIALVDSTTPGTADDDAYCSILSAVDNAAVPVIVIVNEHDDAKVIEALRNGVTDAIRLPLQGEAVRARVSTLIRLRQAHAGHLAYQSKKQAAAADATVRVFARGVAHNFNNMLTAGMGFLSLAMDSTDDGDLLSCLRNVELTQRRMAYLARQLLNFTGDSELRLRTTELSHVLKDTLRLFDATALKSRVALLCDFSALRGVFVEIDEFQLAQAILQILNNAREAMTAPGGRICFSGETTKDEAFIIIEDNGPGMSEEVIRTICDPFYTTKQIVGVGLGLSSTRSIVENLGGRLEIASTLGHGTQVKIALPTQQPEMIIDTDVQESTPFRHGLSLLLAVDAHETRDALQSILLAGSFLVDSIETEEELIESISGQNAPYDLIIVDLLRCDLVGDDILQAIRDLTDIPSIFLYSTLNEAPRRGDNFAILRKPFAAEALLGAIRKFPELLLP